MNDTAPTKPDKPQRAAEPERKPRDVIPVSKLTMRSDLTLNIPSQPPLHGLASDEQMRITYHPALGLYEIAWTPRTGSSGTPWRRYIPREWASFEAA